MCKILCIYLKTIYFQCMSEIVKEQEFYVFIFVYRFLVVGIQLQISDCLIKYYIVKYSNIIQIINGNILKSYNISILLYIIAKCF